MAFAEYNINEEAVLNPPKDLALVEAMTFPASFHGIVAIGAIHLMLLRGDNECPVATYHLTESLRLFKEGMEDPGRDPLQTTDFINAAISLATAEVCTYLLLTSLRSVIDYSLANID